MKHLFNKIRTALSSDPTERLLLDLGCAFEHRADGSLFVPGNIDLSEKDLTCLPDLSTVHIGGNFNCSKNRLTSLTGAPASVGGSFYCDHNQLASLDGAPASVGGNFHCDNNQLSSLKGAPNTVGGGFHCHNNQLTSLAGAPASVRGNFYCDHNQLTSLLGAPASVGGHFYCTHNQLTSLKGAPAFLDPEGRFYCTHNRLVSLEGAPQRFKILGSDFGQYYSWESLPEALKSSPAAKQGCPEDRGLSQGGTIVLKPATIRSRVNKTPKPA